MNYQREIERLQEEINNLRDRIDGSWSLLASQYKKFVLADKDNDGDYEALTSTSWDGDSFSTGVGTIDWNSDFGVPANAKAVQIALHMRDSGSSGADCYVWLAAKSTTSRPNVMIRSQGVENNRVRVVHGIVAIASDGTSYYSINATGSSTMDIWIDVVGYYI